MIIKKKIEQILLLHFYSYFDQRRPTLEDIVTEIADAVRAEVEQGIATAIEVRFNGIPQ